MILRTLMSLAILLSLAANHSVQAETLEEFLVAMQPDLTPHGTDIETFRSGIKHVKGKVSEKLIAYADRTGVIHAEYSIILQAEHAAIVDAHFFVESDIEAIPSIDERCRFHLSYDKSTSKWRIELETPYVSVFTAGGTLVRSFTAAIREGNIEKVQSSFSRPESSQSQQTSEQDRDILKRLSRLTKDGNDFSVRSTHLISHPQYLVLADSEVQRDIFLYVNSAASREGYDVWLSTKMPLSTDGSSPVFASLVVALAKSEGCLLVKPVAGKTPEMPPSAWTIEHVLASSFDAKRTSETIGQSIQLPTAHQREPYATWKDKILLVPFVVAPDNSLIPLAPRNGIFPNVTSTDHAQLAATVQEMQAAESLEVTRKIVNRVTKSRELLSLHEIFIEWLFSHDVPSMHDLSLDSTLESWKARLNEPNLSVEAKSSILIKLIEHLASSPEKRGHLRALLTEFMKHRDLAPLVLRLSQSLPPDAVPASIWDETISGLRKALVGEQNGIAHVTRTLRENRRLRDNDALMKVLAEDIDFSKISRDDREAQAVLEFLIPHMVQTKAGRDKLLAFSSMADWQGPVVAFFVASHGMPGGADLLFATTQNAKAPWAFAIKQISLPLLCGVRHPEGMQLTLLFIDELREKSGNDTISKIVIPQFLTSMSEHAKMEIKDLDACHKWLSERLTANKP